MGGGRSEKKNDPASSLRSFVRKTERSLAILGHHQKLDSLKEKKTIKKKPTHHPAWMEEI